MEENQALDAYKLSQTLLQYDYLHDNLPADVAIAELIPDSVMGRSHFAEMLRVRSLLRWLIPAWCLSGPTCAHLHDIVLLQWLQSCC